MSYSVLSRRSADQQPSSVKAPSSALRIAPSANPLEYEADRMADEALAGRMPRFSLSRMDLATPVQRKCDHGGVDCEECKANQVQRKTAGSAESQPAPPVVHDVLRSPGQPLDSQTRAFFESRFGHDFSGVRTHKGTRESQSARAVNALAYTVGDHIVFGPGAAEPGTPAGQRLLAHELAHTIQQSQGRNSSSGVSRLQRVTADPSAIPAGLTCVTDPSPGSPAVVSLTGIKITGLNATQKKQIADFHKTWSAAATQDFIAVEGYASPDSANDNKAAQQTNWTYSCKRAELVQTEFVHLGVPRSRMLTFAHGETDQFSKGDPDPNRRVNISTVKVTAAGGTGQGAAQASGAGQVPSGFGVNGQAKGDQANVQVKPKGQTENPATKPADAKDKSAANKPAAQQPGTETGPKDREFSVTFEFDLKNDWKLKPPTPPPGTPSAPFLCDHGIYQLGVKWNRGIVIKGDVLELANEPELDLNVGDPLCGEKASITAQVNLIKYTILKDVFEADLVGVLGLPDGWATGLTHFPFTGAAQIKLQSTPFGRLSPDFKNVKIGAFGGIGFEQGVETPGGEEPKTHVWTLGGFIGLDYDFGPAQQK